MDQQTSFLEFTSDLPLPERQTPALSLLSEIPKAAYSGICDRLNEFVDDPKLAVGLAGASGLIGAGISLVGRSKTFGPAAIQLVPKLMLLSGATDLSIKIGLPLLKTAFVPDQRENNARELGHNLGGLLVDYAALGLAGAGGARLATRWRGGTYGQSALDFETNRLAKVIDENYFVSEALASNSFNKTTRRGLRQYLKDEISPKELKKQPELHETIRELNATVSGLQDGLHPYLKTTGILPRVDFGWTLSRSKAYSRVAEAQVAFDSKSMVKGSRADFADSVAHELTHVEQDMLMWRRQADILKLSRYPDKNEMKLLVQTMAELGDDTTNQRFLRAVIKRRQSHPLTESEVIRADKLLREEMQYNNNELLRRKIERRKERLADGIADLDKRDWSDLMRDLKDKPTMQKYLGNTEVTEDLAKSIDRLATIGTAQQKLPLTPEATADRALVRKVLYDKWVETDIKHDRVKSFYKDSFCEKEARTIGARVGWNVFLNSAGMTPLVGVGSVSILHNAAEGGSAAATMARSLYKFANRDPKDSGFSQDLRRFQYLRP